MLKARAYFLWQSFRALFPSRLPTSPAEHTAWASSILALGGFPDNGSFRHALATMVMHLDSLTTWKSKAFFVWGLRKSIANQVAYGIMMDIKQQDKAVNEQSVQDKGISGASEEVVQKA